MAWVTIPDTDIDADSPITVALMTALRDNPAAIAAADAGAPVVRGKFLKFSQITSSGNVTLDSNTRHTIALLVGGGGSGGNADGGRGAGGFAGEMQWSYAARNGGESLTATIGAGGTNGNAGGTTSLTGHASALGGYAGEYNGSPFDNGQPGHSAIGRGGAVKTSFGGGNAAAANSGAGGSGAKSSAGIQYGGAGGSGVIFLWEFA